MSKFPTAGHFASWARVCPGNHESAGKGKPVSTRWGNQWVRDALSEVARAAVRTKGSYYRALYHRHKSRVGSKRAIVVVQHAILVAVWHMFSRGALHEDLGADHFQAHDKERQTRYLLRRLHKLSVDVQVQGDAA